MVVGCVVRNSEGVVGGFGMGFIGLSVAAFGSRE